jgi:hypothetical protein
MLGANPIIPSTRVEIVVIMKVEPIAFAVLDILGYGELMRREPSEVFTVVKELIQSEEKNWTIQHNIDSLCRFSGVA